MLGSTRGPEALPPTGLFLVGVKIARGTNANMPSEFAGAVVPAFAAAADHDSAAKAAINTLVSQGFDFLDIVGEVQQLNPERWTAYVRHTWPEFEDRFPTQEIVMDGLDDGMVFFGPFAAYQSS